jgi:hypothetical protein
MKMMYFAKNQSQTTAAAATSIRQIDSWIMELRSKNLHQNEKLFSLETQIQINHRAADQTYRDAHERFQRELRMEDLPPLPVHDV